MKLSANDSSACIALAAAAAADDDHDDDDDDDDPRLMTTTIASRDASVYNRHHASMYSLDLPAKFKRLMFFFIFRARVSAVSYCLCALSTHSLCSLCFTLLICRK